MALVPTLTLLATDGRRSVLDQARDYARAGGQVLFGTDVGYRPDYDTTREFELLEMTGLSDRKSTRLNSSHVSESRMPSSA